MLDLTERTGPPSTATTDPRPASTRRARLARRWPIATFLVLAYALSWWAAIGRVGNDQAALIVPIGPSIAGILVVGWRFGGRARRDLLRSTIRVRGIGRCWAILLLPVGVSAVAIAVAITAGAGVPGLTVLGDAALVFVVLPLTMVVSGPLGEELGWRGYLLPHLLERFSPVRATLVLLPMWVLFHLPLTLTAPDRFGGWWLLSITALAFALTWAHLGTGGSVLLAVLLHAVANSTTGAAIGLFPEDERPMVWAITSVIWFVVGVVIAVGPLRRGRGSATAAAATVS